jgi:hypothetical protein
MRSKPTRGLSVSIRPDMRWVLVARFSSCPTVMSAGLWEPGISEHELVQDFECTEAVLAVSMRSRMSRRSGPRNTTRRRPAQSSSATADGLRSTAE